MQRISRVSLKGKCRRIVAVSARSTTPTNIVLLQAKLNEQNRVDEALLPGTNSLFPSVHPCLPYSSQKKISKETHEESPNYSAAVIPLEASVAGPDQTERCQISVEIVR
jgi:hypothetical protein